MPLFHASDSIPPSFLCPISHSLMVDPVTLPSGITYDRSSIEKWLQAGNSTCPVTMTAVGFIPQLIPNLALKRLIHDWCVQPATHKSKYGTADSIPSSQISADPEKVRLMLDGIACGTNRLACLKQLSSLANVSEINKRLMQDEGLISLLIDFMGTDIASGDVGRETMEALQEAVCILAALFNMNSIQAGASLGDKKKLSTITWLLNRGSIDARVNAALLLEKLATDEPTAIKLISSSNDVISGLFGLLREDLYPGAVKASLNTLVALYNGASTKEEIKVLIEHRGGVKTLIELLPGAGKGETERILILIRAISLCADGRAAIRDHALAVPVIVRSLLALSELANELAIGVLWAICLRMSPVISALNEALIEEAAELGATQKLLVVAQMDCTVQTKQKTKDLLKALARVECPHSFHTSQRL